MSISCSSHTLQLVYWITINILINKLLEGGQWDKRFSILTKRYFFCKLHLDMWPPFMQLCWSSYWALVRRRPQMWDWSSSTCTGAPVCHSWTCSSRSRFPSALASLTENTEGEREELRTESFCYTMQSFIRLMRMSVLPFTLSLRSAVRSRLLGMMIWQK